MIDRSYVSPQVYARAGGALYLFVFGLGFTLFAYPHLTPSADQASTAQTFSSSQTWLHVVSAAELINFMLDVPLALIFYVLLAPVDRNVALLAAFFRLANGFLGAIIGLGRLAALTLFGDPSYQSAFSPKQLQGLASLALTLHAYGIDICFAFFGMHCIVLGYLIYKSTYLPRFLGVSLPIAGLVYVITSFSDIAAPAFAASIPDAIFAIGFVAELLLCVWLLAKGIDMRKWEELHAPRRVDEAIL